MSIIKANFLHIPCGFTVKLHIQLQKYIFMVFINNVNPAKQTKKRQIQKLEHVKPSTDGQKSRQGFQESRGQI